MSKRVVPASRAEQPDSFSVYENIAWYCRPFVSYKEQKQSKFDGDQMNNVLEREDLYTFRQEYLSSTKHVPRR
jgi:hypothetical protein